MYNNSVIRVSVFLITFKQNLGYFNLLINVEHIENTLLHTENSNEDGFIVVVIIDEMNLRNLFLPRFQLLLYTLHEQLRHGGPETDIKKLKNNKIHIYILHLGSTASLKTA